MNKTLLGAAFLLALAACQSGKIDREALVTRNNPRVSCIDTLASLSVGNGRFAFTADVTGMQTFPELYSHGVPLGTQSQWGWHSFPNPEKFMAEDAFKEFDFGHGHKEIYSCQFRNPGRQHDASEWLRINPHRLHLGVIGFSGIEPDDISGVNQTLDMWKGELVSEFDASVQHYSVRSYCHPEKDAVAFNIESEAKTAVKLRFPYPSGKHSDDGCDWTPGRNHHIETFAQDSLSFTVKHILDNNSYFVKLCFENAVCYISGDNELTLEPSNSNWSITALFSESEPDIKLISVEEVADASAEYWKEYWTEGGVADFSRCTDPRAKELERRVVLSQYLLAIQCAGDTPPQETGLTYNSWFGKFHLEMIWWHQAQFALWGHGDLLERSLKWYSSAEPMAKSIAERQGFKGVRWMKMTDPSAQEAPSNVGSFLIWQQPHPIYLAELVYRADPSQKVLDKYFDIVQESAEFMADFASYDEANDRYVLKGCIAAQETLRADKTINPPFELSYWHFGLLTAQLWRERMGLERVKEWDIIIEKLSSLASNNGLYLAAESEPETYSDVKMFSDHMAVLAAMGVLPKSPQFEEAIMKNTFDWVYDNWNWDQTWGWDYPVTCMNAVRLGEPEKAINALLMDKRTNTYLPNGHNYQDGRLRCYLPGNGGLLAAVALMCAGWDGCKTKNPGFPKDGSWDVRWEGIKAMP